MCPDYIHFSVQGALLFPNYIHLQGVYTIVLQNIEKHNVEKQNVEFQNIELQNVELQNVESYKR